MKDDIENKPNTIKQDNLKKKDELNNPKKFPKKKNNKLGLSWAKLRSCWDWTLL